MLSLPLQNEYLLMKYLEGIEKVLGQNRNPLSVIDAPRENFPSGRNIITQGLGDRAVRLLS